MLGIAATTIAAISTSLQFGVPNDVPSRTALDAVEQKLYAFLWKVPDDTHRQVMQLLRNEFEGRDLDRSFDLEIAFWTRDRLTELATPPA